MAASGFLIWLAGNWLNLLLLLRVVFFFSCEINHLETCARDLPTPIINCSRLAPFFAYRGSARIKTKRDICLRWKTSAIRW